MQSSRLFLFIVILLASLCSVGQEAASQQRQAAQPRAIPPIEERIRDMKKLDGFFPLYWDERSGSMFMEIPRFDYRLLVCHGIVGGIGIE